jgi:hypothetical protein
MKKLICLTAILAGAALAIVPTNLRAAEKSAEKAGKNDGFVGVVTKVDPAAKTLTVKNAKSDKEATFTFSEETNVVDDDGKEIAITTIKEGVRIRVHADEGKDAARRIKVTEKKKAKKE